MTGILAGLRIVEGSAFIAAPLGGMTLAQLGADVIRFDDIGGGLDSDRLAGGPGTEARSTGRVSTRASARSPSTCAIPAAASCWRR
jgi:crotonobetainyl-CoA:carnitine CoA-transferase CaiB-like acyl-CoA transferase